METKKELIIQAALAVFSRDGVHKGKIADIAKEANIGKGTVYEYFRSKDEIFEAIFTIFLEQTSGTLHQIMEMDLTPVEKLQRLVDYSFEFFDESNAEIQNSYWSILFEIFAHSIRDQILGVSKYTLGDHFRGLIEKTLVPVLQDGMNSGDFKRMDVKYLAFFIFTALDGVMIHFFLNREYFKRQPLRQIIMDTILHGILQPKSDTNQGDKSNE